MVNVQKIAKAGLSCAILAGLSFLFLGENKKRITTEGYEEITGEIKHEKGKKEKKLPAITTSQYSEPSPPPELTDSQTDSNLHILVIQNPDLLDSRDILGPYAISENLGKIRNYLESIKKNNYYNELKDFNADLKKGKIFIKGWEIPYYKTSEKTEIIIDSEDPKYSLGLEYFLNDNNTVRAISLRVIKNFTSQPVREPVVSSLEISLEETDRKRGSAQIYQIHDAEKIPIGYKRLSKEDLKSLTEFFYFLQ